MYFVNFANMLNNFVPRKYPKYKYNMSEQLVTEYNFSTGVECFHDSNVENWWLVRLTESNVLGLDWSSQAGN